MLSLIQPLMWVVAGAAVGVSAAGVLWTWKRRGAPSRPFLVAVAASVAAAVLVVPAVGFVPAGHRGVVYEWGGGVSQGERGEGITFLVPWVQTMKLMSVRTQKVFSAKVFAQSLDLQEITVPVSVNYRVDPARAAELYQEVGPDYRDTVIMPALFQRTKAAIGQVRAEDFARRRGPLARTVQEQLTEQLSRYGIVVEFVNIEDAIFDPAFVKAVKNKIIAEQKAQEQRRLIAAQEAIKRQTIIKAEATAQSVLLRASARAEANRRLNRSLTPQVIRWRWLETWNGTLPATLVGGQDMSLLLGIGGAGDYSYGG